MNVKLRTIPLIVAMVLFFSLAGSSLAEAKSEIKKTTFVEKIVQV